MTDAQLVAIAITVLTVLGGTIINNTRLGDVKEVLRAELKLTEARMDARFASIDTKLDQILRILGNHDSRITALDQRLR
jgi:metallophosphoesterase superfamily enzyme